MRKDRWYVLRLLLLLRIRSAHVEMLDFPLPYRDVFVRFKTMRRNQNLSSALGGNHAFSEIIKRQFDKKNYHFLELLYL